MEVQEFFTELKKKKRLLRYDATKLEPFRVFSHIFSYLYRKMARKYWFSQIRFSNFSALEVLVGPVMILVQDIGDIYNLSEADF